MNPANDTDDRS